MSLDIVDDIDERGIEGRREDEWDTLYRYYHNHAITERWGRINDGDPKMHFWLKAGFNDAGQPDPTRWAPPECSAGVCTIG